MELADYKKLSKQEQDLLKAKLIYAFENSKTYFMFGDSAVNNAELDGLFVDVDFTALNKEPAY